jgi:hypothetical protein
MTKRNLSALLIIIAMLLNILNFDFSSEKNSKAFILFILSIIVLISAIVLIFKKESK